MGYLYKAFCYSNTANLFQAITSYEDATITPMYNNGYIYHVQEQIQSYYIHSQNETTIYFRTYTNQRVYDSNGQNISSISRQFDRDLFKCSNPGKYIEEMNITIPQNSITLQTPASLESPSPIDTATASTLVVTVLACAWAFKVLRRTL